MNDFIKNSLKKGKLENFQKLIIKYNSKLKLITLIFISILFIYRLNKNKMK